MTVHDAIIGRYSSPYSVDCNSELGSVLHVLSGTFYRCEVKAPWAMNFMSEGVEELTGHGPEYFSRRPWGEIIHPGDLTSLDQKISASVKAKTIFSLEYRILSRSGETIWVRDRGRAIYDDNNDPQFLEGIIIDISLEKRLEEAAASATALISASRAQLADVLESSLDCVFNLDREWRFTYLNGRASAEIGPAANLLGRHLLEAFPTVSQTPFWDAYQQVMAERQPQRVEGYIEALSSWYEAYAAPLNDDGITVFFSNINQRKEAEQALRDRHHLLQKTLNHIPQIVWSAQPDGFHDYYNKAWYEFTGVPNGSTDGEGWNIMFHPDDQERARAAWQLSLRTGEMYEIEYRLRHHSGEYRWVLGRASPEQDNAGRVMRWYGTCTDVHDRVQAQQALRASDARTKKILNSVPQVIWSAGADGQLNFVSQQWAVLYDGQLDDLLGEGWLELVHPEDAAEVARSWKAATHGPTPYRSEFRIRVADGSYRWAMVSALPDFDEEGNLDGWFGSCADVHDRIVAEEALRESEHLHRSVLEASADCIKIIDLSGRILLMNSPGQRAVGISDPDLVQGSVWSSIWPTTGRHLVQAALKQAQGGEVARFSGYCPTLLGVPKWWDVVVSPVFDEVGTVARMIVISRDITKERETSEQLKWTSEHDALTTLPNRRAFQARLQAATIRAMESGGSVGLLLIDLDHFKHVNDTLGHAAGDHLLEAFGRRLKDSVRSGDFIARLGGDEFAVILEGNTQDKDLLRTGESILVRLKQPITFNGRVVSAGASIGGSLFPADAQTAQDLFNNADTALYARKESGRGGTKIFHLHMREQAEKVASQLSLARIAVSEKTIEPHYQQKVELSTGQVKGFEALLRWRHPTKGIQHPDSVAEAFKDYELAAKIGDLMQRCVFMDMRRWRDNGLEFGVVSINAAPAEFLRDDFAERLVARMREFEITPDRVEIEVTEHVFFDRTSHYVSRALARLDEAGVRISLDDFGTGYSSLSHLRDFPVDVVKIDQSFIAKMTENEEMMAIVSAVIDLTASLNIGVVAEGIETDHQRRLLIDRGCGFGQGHLFGRAVACDEVPHLLRNGAA